MVSSDIGPHLIGGREVRVNATMDWMPTVLARHRAIEQEPLPRNIDALLTRAALSPIPIALRGTSSLPATPSPMRTCVNRFRAVRADCGRSACMRDARLLR